MLEGRSVLSRLRSKESMPGTLAESYSATGMELRSLSPVPLELVVSGSTRNLDTVLQEELSRIGREALFNAYVHSNASKIEAEIHFGSSNSMSDSVTMEPELIPPFSVRAALADTSGCPECESGYRKSVATWNSGVGLGRELKLKFESRERSRIDKPNLRYGGAGFTAC
jgi:hypothetical protein